MSDEDLSWHKVAEVDELPDGRVKTFTVDNQVYALSHVGEQYGCLDNTCPHQGGPLGEGSIEKGWLRCPWHGYDYDPITGNPPGGFSDNLSCFDTEVRDDGVYVALPQPPTPKRTVSDVMVETMTNWGVRAVFGMVGHSNLGFAEALHNAEQRGDLRFFGIRHEGAASFAASAYGKLTGELAACFGIAGPGSTNLLTGLYDANIDRAPVLAISGQVPSKVAGRGAFQDLDLAAAFADVAAYSQTVYAESDHAELASLACKHALIERGVAHLILPDEVQVIEADEKSEAGSPAGRVGSQRLRPPESALAAAVSAIADSTRPLVIVGAGARFDMDQILRFAEKIGAPVATTFRGKGQIPDDHPLACGVLGRSGTPVASWFMNESDLIVVFGASFSNHTGIATYKPTVQVDFDPMALGRFHAIEYPVLGHVGVTAAAFIAALPEQIACINHRPEVAERTNIWHTEKRSREADDKGSGVGAAALFAALSRHTDDDAIITVDVGNNAYSFGRYFEVQNQTVLMSGYLGSIGFAFPAAMGAWAAAGDTRQIVSISGDGGFGQYAMELTTAVKYDMNITHILVDNNELGKISKEQRAGNFNVWQTSLHNPDFTEFARICGAQAIRVENASGLDAALTEGLSHDGPTLIHVISDVNLI
jgi:pyruvate oxidase